ncbi:MAG: MdtA/MuxA family multidrug efflux RND transporter periplasmic adaptor subunit [Gammaproteobacteria bacterium]
MEQKPFYRKTYFWLSVLILLVIAILVRWCAHPNRNRLVEPIPVVLATARVGDVPVYLSALGSVTPTYTVTVRTQINGQLWLVAFKEGQFVKAGDVLAQIDPRPYEAQLVQFEGQLARDQALLDNSRIDLHRYKVLYKQNSISQQVLATQYALVRQNEGTVKLDEGQIQQVQINLIYCRIISPVTGRIGLRLVDPGNFVQTTDATGIAVIATLNPITVVFSIPEDDIPQVSRQVMAGNILIVKAYDREQNQLLAIGKLMAIDSEIDSTTGTVKLKAQFENNGYRLFPSQFVNIRLLVSILQKATVVPTAAIQQGAQGPYVYLVNKDNTVSAKFVTVGITSGDYTVVTKGVLANQQVVIEGVDRLSEGAKIKAYEPTNNANKPRRTVP